MTFYLKSPETEIEEPVVEKVKVEKIKKPSEFLAGAKQALAGLKELAKGGLAVAALGSFPISAISRVVTDGGILQSVGFSLMASTALAAVTGTVASVINTVNVLRSDRNSPKKKFGAFVAGATMACTLAGGLYHHVDDVIEQGDTVFNKGRTIWTDTFFKGVFNKNAYYRNDVFIEAEEKPEVIKQQKPDV